MKNNNEYRVTIFFNEEEYRKLKYIAEHLKKHNRENSSIPKLSVRLLSILTEALDDKKTEARSALLSIMDKENKEKNIKTILENIQNDQDNNIDSPKMIEDLVFLSNVKKAIRKMEEENAKTTNESKENENKEDTERETKVVEENKTTEEKQQKEDQGQKEEKIKTKVENKDNNNNNEEEEIMVFPDL